MNLTDPQLALVIVAAACVLLWLANTALTVAAVRRGSAGEISLLLLAVAAVLLVAAVFL